MNFGIFRCVNLRGGIFLSAHASRFVVEKNFVEPTVVNEAADTPTDNRRKQARPAELIVNFLQTFLHGEYLRNSFAVAESHSNVAQGECETDAD